jgi:hypothetical protein
MRRNPDNEERRLQDDLEAQEYWLAADRADQSDQADGAVWIQVRLVDRLFHDVPMLEAPIGFAERVMEAIAAREGLTPDRGRTRRRFRLPWLAVAAAAGILLAGGALAVGAAGPSAAVLGLLLQQAVGALNILAAQLAELFLPLSGLSIQPGWLMAAIGMVILNGVALWWLMGYAATRREQVIYRLPVRVH